MGVNEADKNCVWTFDSQNSAGCCPGVITQKPPCVWSAVAFGAELALRADFFLGVMTFDPGGAPFTSRV